MKRGVYERRSSVEKAPSKGHVAGGHGSHPSVASAQKAVREALHGAFPFAGVDCDRLTERVLAKFC